MFITDPEAEEAAVTSSDNYSKNAEHSVVLRAVDKFVKFRSTFIRSKLGLGMNVVRDPKFGLCAELVC